MTKRALPSTAGHPMPPVLEPVPARGEEPRTPPLWRRPVAGVRARPRPPRRRAAAVAELPRMSSRQLGRRPCEALLRRRGWASARRASQSVCALPSLLLAPLQQVTPLLLVALVRRVWRRKSPCRKGDTMCRPRLRWLVQSQARLQAEMSRV